MRKNATSIAKSKWANSFQQTGQSIARGFSLLEVIVALAVLATALAAVIGVAIAQTRAEQRINTRFFAAIVAKNVLAQNQLSPLWPELGESSGRVSMGPQNFVWQLRVIATPSAELRRLDVQISEDLAQGLSEARARPVLKLSAFARRR
jgi:general secretion pathway protein I